MYSITTTQIKHTKSLVNVTPDVLPYIPQNKYREEGRKTLRTSVYSQLAETTDTQFVKTMTDLQSDVSDTNITNTHRSSLTVMCCVFQVNYKAAGKKQMTGALYSVLPETLETQHAREITQLLSEVCVCITCVMINTSYKPTFTVISD